MLKKLLCLAAVTITLSLFAVPVAANGNNPHGASCVLPRDCASGLCRLSAERGGMRCAAPDKSVTQYGECWFDAECGWGKCQKVSQDHYICGCTGDSQCASSEWCNNSGSVRCEPQMASGSSCNRKRQCLSDACQLCPTDLAVQQVKSLCAGPATVNLGGSCLFDRDCKKGKCSSPVACTRGECVCAEDSDCPTNQRCDKGKLGIGQNQCVPK